MRKPAEQPKPPPVKYCREKGCGKKMAAFKRGRGWRYICPDEGKHQQAKLQAKQLTGSRNKGGVTKGKRVSPKLGREYPKPIRPKWRWGKEKDNDPRNPKNKK